MKRREFITLLGGSAARGGSAAGRQAADHWAVGREYGCNPKPRDCRLCAAIGERGWSSPLHRTPSTSTVVARSTKLLSVRWPWEPDDHWAPHRYCGVSSLEFSAPKNTKLAPLTVNGFAYIAVFRGQSARLGANIGTTYPHVSLCAEARALLPEQMFSQ
jgi:hypothetical protein